MTANGGVFSNSTLSGAISAAYADANPNLSGNQALGANQAIFFGWNGGKYVSVNDGLAPFNACQHRPRYQRYGHDWNNGDRSINSYQLLCCVASKKQIRRSPRISGF